MYFITLLFKADEINKKFLLSNWKIAQLKKRNIAYLLSGYFKKSSNSLILEKGSLTVCHLFVICHF